ncbi:MAG: hypothetical protein ACRC5C_12295, partial [Bacilli bacterium]
MKMIKGIKLVACVTLVWSALGLGVVESANYPMWVTKGKTAAYNWGLGSPGGRIPKDKFKAEVDLTQRLEKGDYYIQSFMDDGGFVSFNKKTVLKKGTSEKNKWARTTLAIPQSATYPLKASMVDNAGAAALFTHIVPFDTWTAYYYQSSGGVGSPTAATTLARGKEWGFADVIDKKWYTSKKPFSTKYTTASKLTPGQYTLTLTSTDEVSVYVDGVKMVERKGTNMSDKQTFVVNISETLDNIHFFDVVYTYRGTEPTIGMQLMPYSESAQLWNPKTWTVSSFPNGDWTGVRHIQTDAPREITSVTSAARAWFGKTPGSVIFTRTFKAQAKDYILRYEPQAGAYITIDGVRQNLNASDAGAFRWSATAGNHKIEIGYTWPPATAKLAVNIEAGKPNETSSWQTIEPQLAYNWGD